MIAEYASDATPDGMQHLLGRAVWDTDGMRDDGPQTTIIALTCNEIRHR